jgi:hypothetical protein
MNSTAQLNEKEEILSFEVSDEVLESAAGTELTPPYTIALCTWLLVCPSWADPE